MRLHRWLFSLLCFVLLLGFVPARAAEPEAITDKGGNVYDIDPQRGELPNVLPDAEADQIAVLQSAQRVVEFLSPISPDDQAVFAVVDDTPGFFNIQDGTFLPLDLSAAFERFIPIAIFTGQWGWRDERRLTSIGAEILNQETGEARAVLVYIDRLTGEVTAEPISFDNIPSNAAPVATSPDGTKLIIAAPPENSGALQLRQVPVTFGRTVADDSPKLSAAYQAKVNALARTPFLQAAQRMAPLFKTDENSFNMFEVSIRLLSYDAVTGEVKDLRALEVGTVAIGYAWSQDSAKFTITFTNLFDARQIPDVRQRRRPFDGALISEQVYRDVTGNLPPAQNPFLQNNTLETFDVNTGESQALRARDGDGVLLAVPQWSTDNQSVMVQVWHPGRLVGRRYPIYTPQFAERTSFRFYNTALRETRRFEAAEVSASLSTRAVFASPDEVIFRAITGTNYYPYYYNRVTGEFRRMADKPGTYRLVTPTRNTRQVTFYYTSFTEPNELYRMNWDGSGLVALTDLNAEIRSASNIRTDAVSFRLSNGQSRVGVLIQPADAPFPPRNTRVVVWQEGGPGGTMNNQWNADVERPFALLPNMGVALLVVPLAGREGYGPRVYNALYDRNNFGQLDIDEQAQIVNQMIRQGWTSRGKVGISGCSYGGYFATQSITRYPDLYAAANAQCALVDNIVEWNRGYVSLMPYLQGLPPWKNLQEYRRDSPVYNADVIKTPLLTFHGTDDFLPITLNQNLHQQLFNREVPSKMLIFVGAGHGISSVRGRSDGGDPLTEEDLAALERYAGQELVQWYRRYLQP